MRSGLALLLLAALAALGTSAPEPQWPGPKRDGFLLPTGWRLVPTGIQVPLPDTLPMTLVLHPDGKQLFILSAGYTQPSVLILDPEQPGREGGVTRVGLSHAWLGLVIHPEGDGFYVTEGNAGTVREFSFTESEIKPEREFKLFEGVTNPLARGRQRWNPNHFLGDAALHPDGKRLYVADMQAGLVYELDLDKGRDKGPDEGPDKEPDKGPDKGPDKEPDKGPDKEKVARQIRVGAHPYRLLVSSDGTRLYVSNWGSSNISVIEVATGRVQATFASGAHPSDMLLAPRGRLYVACSNTNEVYVHDTDTGAVRERIWVALHPKAPPGSTPNALAMAPDGSRLYVANADNNVLAVITPGAIESRVEGFIPTGWYPTAVQVSPNGRRLFVANGKGQGSRANPGGPQPDRLRTPQTEYTPRIQRGSLSIINVPDAAQLKILTRRALAASPYHDGLLETAPGPGTVIPTQPGGATPIRHVIYIIKEDRTYDQVFGDIPEGNGDPSLVLFGETVTPNHHRLARQFVLLDNFYASADVSADGHNWSMGALANDYVQKLWPATSAGRRALYDYQGPDPTSRPPGGYLWDAARKAAVSFRLYGEWTENPEDPRQPVRPRVKELEDHVAPSYRNFDLNYSDRRRAEEWLREFREFEKNGNLPQLQIVRLPNDHTAGTRPGAWTPRAMVADNDMALGRIVEAVTRSRYWKETAIFVLEDDAQNGPDHVDSHRSIALVISPYAKRGAVDSTMYSTVSVLRTIELILGLPPLTQHDAAATPMFAAFTDKPDFRSYTAVKPEVNLNERNPPEAPGPAASARMDFSDVNLMDDQQMSAILSPAIKANVLMPAPLRSASPSLLTPKTGDTHR